MRNDLRLLIGILLLYDRAAVAEGGPLGLPLPFFLRGGSTKTMTKQTPRRTRQRRKPGANPIQLVGQGLQKVGGKMQHDVVFVGKHVGGLGKNIGREWGKLTSNTRRFVADIPKILPLPKRRKKLKSCKKLDEVCHTFSSVLKSGNEVDTAQLLKACRAHLAFMKSGGSSLRLVAKDLEANVAKAEKVFKKSPKEGRCLSSLLQIEKERGIHNGSELQEKSAAMGLLWIRRSLKFQLDLYAALIHGANHPRDAAYDAYAKHLGPFHGWALRKVFPASLSQMPERDVFIAKFGGIDLEELDDEIDRVIAKKLKALVNAWDPLIGRWEEEYDRLGLEDTRRV